jgi:hypothetical protein
MVAMALVEVSGNLQTLVAADLVVDAEVVEADALTVAAGEYVQKLPCVQVVVVACPEHPQAAEELYVCDGRLVDVCLEVTAESLLVQQLSMFRPAMLEGLLAGWLEVKVRELVMALGHRQKTCVGDQVVPSMMLEALV